MTASLMVAASRPCHQRRVMGRAATALAAIVMLISIVVINTPPHLEADEIVREYGTYVSPGKRFRVVVEETDNQMIKVGFESKPTFRLVVQRFFNRSRRRQVPVFSEFEVERDWFLCFDEFDRLWIFTGRRDPKIEARKTSGGGTRPRVQSVMMKGFSFINGRTMGTEMVVTGIGDWRGVPPQFFDQIPGKDDPSLSIWGENPPIPADPPEFTPAERAAALAYWRNFDAARNSLRTF